MKLETNLVHENGQYIHDGDPFYEGDKLVGWFRGLHDDGGLSIAMVNVEKPNGGGITPVFIGVVASWNTSPATPEPASDAPPADEVCSSPEPVEFQQGEYLKREIELSLVETAVLPLPVHELVNFALQSNADREMRKAALGALQELAEYRRKPAPEIPF